MFDYYDSIPVSFWFWFFFYIAVNAFFLLHDRSLILEGLGLPAWKGRIPFYGAYLLYERIWKKEAFWQALAGLGGRFFSWYLLIGCVIEGPIRFSDVPDAYGFFLFGIFILECLCTIVGLAIHYMAMVYLSKAFDRSPWFALGLLLCPMVYMSILVYSGVEYLDDDELEELEDEVLE